jgi:metal-responsive CopG/Arc/MetJ family transcriptional regulator
MKTAISLPDDLFKAADSLAGKLGMSRSRLYATAIEEYLARHQSRRVSERLDAVYATEASTLDPSVAAAQGKTLKRSEW